MARPEEKYIRSFRLYSTYRYEKPGADVVPIDTRLRDEFVAASEHMFPEKMRDLCLKHDPRYTFGMFMTQPYNRKKPAERLISVKQLIEEKAIEAPSGSMPEMLFFIRLLCINRPKPARTPEP